MNARQFAANDLPPVCGFNLLEKFSWSEHAPRGRRFQEWDFDFMVRHGFSFVRLPMDYRCWLRDFDGREGSDRRSIDESVLHEIDQAVQMGRDRGMHVCINIHRAPGYCINWPEIEPYNLWTDEPAQADFVHHWRTFAEFFRGYDNQQVSFDLLNEPPSYGQRGFTKKSHRRVMGLVVNAIREVSPQRLIICDGHDGGHSPNPELLDLGVAQSMRGYAPHTLTHYNAPWANRPTPWPTPAWPAPDERGGPLWNRARLWEDIFHPWRKLQEKGIGVHCGEMGVYNQTPPEVTYAFLNDVLDLLTGNGWGWALWNLRGSFGVLDNGRRGTKTEPLDGHELDRTMLEILKRHLP